MCAKDFAKVLDDNNGVTGARGGGLWNQIRPEPGLQGRTWLVWLRCLHGLIQAKEVCDLNDYQIDDKNEYRGNYDRGVGCLANAFCSFLRIITFIGADDTDGEAEKIGLYISGQDVSEAEVIDDLPEEQGEAGIGADVDADEGAEEGNGISEYDQYGQHQGGGGYSCYDQVFERVGTADLHRVYLFGDLHGAQLGAHAAGNFAGKDEGGYDRSDLSYYSDAYHDRQLGFDAINDQGWTQLHGEHEAHDKTGQSHQREGIVADDITLSYELAELVSWPAALQEIAAGEAGYITRLIQEGL